ncbi:GPW/gp25 family protein [Pseudomonas lalucatii]|uniref:GPW/gp25 family protein n=1 Tax=Pseudomonas lalucatii TaxID=1424203 RepID=A0ABS5PVJ9_9PSED|nr:GPW/gp25 family protein [Pseudomonas lalucatii]MBS7660557.1 GPW/gp25 family protein [Pseudomonas lalucatii]MBS7724590.1 GPW/gp25 family protein [Pseudomonas lalucatii]QVM87421.1 GPW/gp25 family protein [Pseudomonas lalucatii]
MNRATGRAITRLEHLRQSVADILTTRIGSRVMRREYGSLLPELIDQPFNGTTRLRAYAATAMALMRWEPRLRLTRVQLSQGSDPGQVEITLDATVLDSNEQQSLSIPLRLGAIL